MASDATGPGMPAFIHLDRFGAWVDDAFGAMPYMVGSAARGKQWRDVDVRLVLDDARFAELFPGPHGGTLADPLWSIICAGLSALAERWSGLPVDFQIQSMTKANGPGNEGPRVPLGIRIRPDQDASGEGEA